ncbi:porin, Gram-negative type [Psychromonas ingrahamii 37]|uniref:Porin, Gram-negative type n=1 Tax=Psychromonas ingrahamii (strain DSM 17664 / CCUG 51855 / 37) TaxID=357804 RepID=A1SSQ4_PSYIN|nr:porin [Psychromonas ingrahamii]ABM02519.1 porin, Gram-negative type [Psychromonas ingrahamii 37]
MKKTLLAVAIPALLFANASSAVELYNDAANTFSIGGHVAMGLAGSDEGETQVASVSPRINFEATRDLGEGYTMFLRTEWSVNTLDGGANSFSTRLGYLGLSHADNGTAIIGTQWSPYYSVGGVADLPVAFANGSLYSDHYNLGTGRAERMVSYSNKLDLGTAGALKLGLGWQGKHAAYDTRVQAALTYSVMDVTLGYAHNTGDVAADKAVSNIVSAKYGSYGNGLYAAVSYADNEFMNNALAETSQTSAIAAYALPSSVNLSVNYETVENDLTNKTLNESTAFQVEYKPFNNVLTYVGYQVDLGDDDATTADDNKWALGARLYL